MQIRWLPLTLGCLMTIAALILQLYPPAYFKAILDELNYTSYDLRLKFHAKKNIAAEKSPIIIIAIDEESLKAQGRWPWPRDKVGQLVENLYKAGAIIVAFDVLFIEPEENIAQQIINELTAKDPETLKLHEYLNKIKSSFDNDKELAKALAIGDSILSNFFFNVGKESEGALVDPLLDIKNIPQHEDIGIFDMQYYLGNLQILQNAASGGGSVTVIPDTDGIVRRVPLLIKYNDKIYPGLSLEIARQYLLLDNIKVDFDHIDELNAVRDIRLGNIVIPTNEVGQMIIPFAGPAFTIPYLSASDVLSNKIPTEILQGKIALIGASAVGIGDVHGTPLQYAGYPGVEVHASAVAAILSENFLYTPVWALGLQVSLIIIMGVVASLLFPRLSLFTLFTMLLIFIISLIGLDTWFWVSHRLVISDPFIAIFLLCVIAVVNVSYRVLFENRQRKKLNDMFGQYVPKEHIKNMLNSTGSFGLEGESREMSVLFSDIRDFTTISENLSAKEVKKMLNTLFTPITKLIFDNQGTIDKYVGDMVMAFWGAPIQDPKHAEHAVRTALEITKTIKTMKTTFDEMGLPKIDMGIGINTGMMDVGDMGSEFRRSYTVLGDEVNLGSRLESLTKFYHVDLLISGTTQEATQGLISRHLDFIRVKGKSSIVDVFEPVGFAEDISSELQLEVEEHNKAVTEYLAQNWHAAQKIFQALREKNPGYYIYEMYLQRIEQFITEPPGENWDGVFIHLEK